jgi:protein gp37
MPDGSVAICYAEAVAERLAASAYPHGFAHHYWRPEMLQAPLKVKQPAKIFLDSMSDLMGHWVPDEQRVQLRFARVARDVLADSCHIDNHMPSDIAASETLESAAT